MGQTTKKALIVISVLCLLNVFFLPIFEIFGGLFPDDTTSFVEVLEAAFEDGDAWDYRVVRFTMFIFLPSVFLLIGALSGSKGSCVLASGAGIVLWFINMIDLISDTDIELVMDFDSTPVSIGSWIAVVLFFVAFSRAKKAENINREYIIGSSSQNLEFKTCPICGTVLEKDASFCGVCGSQV